MRCNALCSHLLEVIFPTGGGDEGEKEFVDLKWASQFWFPIQNFIFPSRKIFWGLGWVGPKRGHSPPPPPVGKQMTGPVFMHR